MDEADNYCEALAYSKKDKYFVVFQFLYTWFFEKSNTSISAHQFQTGLGIVYHPEVYHLLNSFQILKLIEKTKLKGRRNLYIIKNKEWWPDLKKELANKYKQMEEEYNGSTKTD